MKQLNVAILGFGTVGSGVYNVLTTNCRIITDKTGFAININKILVSNKEKYIIKYPKIPRYIFTTNLDDILNDSKIDLVVELIGGYDVAFEYTKRALKTKKHVVTANKAMLAIRGDELFAIADDNNVLIKFEAAVGGGIPVLKVLSEGLAGNQVKQIAGIINGTTNYILTELKNTKMKSIAALKVANDNKTIIQSSVQDDFAMVLKNAQDLGYAEADPTFDIEGIDAAHKISILAQIGFGVKINFNDIYSQGIAEITSEDLSFAKKLKYSIKHLGIAKLESATELSIRSHPCLVEASSVISGVNGVMNAVYIDSDKLGGSMYYGAGAGSLPTASAVVADIIDITRLKLSNAQELISNFSFPMGFAKKNTAIKVIPISQTKNCYYIRLYAENIAGVLAKITKLLAAKGISIDKLLQVDCDKIVGNATIVMITNQVLESKMQDALKEVQDLSYINSVQLIRVANI